MSHKDHFFMPKVIVSVIALLSSVNPVYIVFFSLEIAAIKKDCSDHLPGAMREGEFFLISLWSEMRNSLTK